ncbi:MAG: hypothetical protein FWG68_04155 [Defluviitaleaceae bacterium]|nr:hypothetical protein [Defluviitaleaceae bacterium]
MGIRRTVAPTGDVVVGATVPCPRQAGRSPVFPFRFSLSIRRWTFRPYEKTTANLTITS